MQRISREDLQTPLDRGAISLVEALPEAQYEAEHLPWAVNLPGDLTEELARSLAPDRPTTVVTGLPPPGTRITTTGVTARVA